MADAERNGPEVLSREIAVQQIRDDALAAGGEHFLWNLLAGGERLSRQRHLAACARDLELELPFRIRQHDEAALGAGGVDGRVHHENQHFIEQARRAQSPQSIEQRRQRPEVDDARGVTGVGVGRVVEQEDHLDAATAAEPDRVAMTERPFRDLIAVDERAAARAAILQYERSIDLDDFGVLARHIGA